MRERYVQQEALLAKQVDSGDELFHMMASATLTRGECVSLSMSLYLSQAHTQIYICIHKHTHTPRHTHIHTYIHTYIYTYIYTHTHTHKTIILFTTSSFLVPLSLSLTAFPSCIDDPSLDSFIMLTYSSETFNGQSVFNNHPSDCHHSSLFTTILFSTLLPY